MEKTAFNSAVRKYNFKIHWKFLQKFSQPKNQKRLLTEGLDPRAGSCIRTSKTGRVLATSTVMGDVVYLDLTLKPLVSHYLELN
jgi:hypothetical protein